MAEIFMGPLLDRAPRFFFFGLLVAASFFYFTGWREILRKNYLTYAALFFRVIYAAILTWGQYIAWSSSELGRQLLQMPVNESVPSFLIRVLPWIFNTRFGYFIFYSWNRFWLNVVLSIFLAAVFWIFLRFLNKHKERFFGEGEVELGFLTALLAGWPNVFSFIILTFLFAVGTSLARRIFFEEYYTTLGPSFIFAAFVTLILGDVLLYLFNLAVLKI